MDKLNFVFLIGSNPDKDQPILSLKLCKVSNTGGKIISLNSLDHNTAFKLTKNIMIDRSDYIKFLLKLLKAYITKTDNKIDLFLYKHLNNIVHNELHIDIIDNFLNIRPNIIIIGSCISRHNDFSQILNLSRILANSTKSNFMILTDGPNSSGGWLTGCIPHRIAGNYKSVSEIGLNASEMFKKSLKCYILLNVDPEYDTILKSQFTESLKLSQCVIMINSFADFRSLEYSDILLPTTVSYETSGTFININGLSQSFSGVSKIYKNIRPGWKILQALGNLSYIKKYIKTKFEYQSSVEIFEEFTKMLFKGCIDIHNISFDFNVWRMINIKTKCSKYDISLIDFKSNDCLTRNAKSLQNKYSIKIIQ